MPTTKRAKEIIQKIPYITIASLSKDGEVWNAPVYTAYDKYYNFYWGSHVGSQHSQNIAHSPNIFLVIYDSTATPGSGEGVYVRATAAEIADSEEIKTVHQLLWNRHVVPYWKIEQVQGDAPIRLYKAVPQKVWMNDGAKINGHYVDIRTEIQL